MDDLATPLQQARAHFFDKGLGLGELLLEGQLPGVEDLEHRVLADHLRRHVLEHGEDAVDPVAGDEPCPLALQQLGSKGEIPAPQGVLDGPVGQVMALAPAGSGVQQGRAVAVSRQAPLEELGEQVMVAEPLALLVQGDDEELLALQAHQHVQAVAPAGQSVAQVGAELVQHRGLIEELLQGHRQAVDHVLGQVVSDVALGAAEAGEEGRAIRIPRQRQTGQMQRGDPPLGARVQLLEFAAAQLQRAHVAEVDFGLLQGQAQVLGLEHEGLVLDEKAARGEAGAADQVHVAGQTFHQVASALFQAGVANAVEVVEHQVQLVLQALQVTDEGIDDGLHRPVHLAAEQAGGVGAETGYHRLDGRHQVLQQSLRLAVRLVTGEPGDPCTLALQRLTEQAEHGALAKAGRRAEHQHAALTCLPQAVDQHLARQARLTADLRRVELGAQQVERLADAVHGNNPSSRARRMAWVRLRTLSFS